MHTHFAPQTTLPCRTDVYLSRAKRQVKHFAWLSPAMANSSGAHPLFRRDRVGRVFSRHADFSYNLNIPERHPDLPLMTYSVLLHLVQARDQSGASTHTHTGSSRRRKKKSQIQGVG